MGDLQLDFFYDLGGHLLCAPQKLYLMSSTFDVLTVESKRSIAVPVSSTENPPAQR
jgi:hypothetical protein